MLVEKKNRHTEDSINMLRDDDIKIDQSYNDQYNEELEKFSGLVVKG